jgi:diguanylate cyclase (GGDEF)-like protein/PAS domain S-box-containing protein
MFSRTLHRRLLRPAAFGGCYFAAAAATVGSTRFGGGVACLWIASAVLLAALTTTPRHRWPALIGACAAASTLVTGVFGLGWAAAPALALVNVGEAIVAAMLMARLGTGSRALDSLERLLVFALAAGVAGPLASGVVGAGVATSISGTPYAANLLNWVVGHALGTLSFAPVFTLIAAGGVRRWFARASKRRIAEGAVLMLVVLATTVAVFAQHSRPLLFLPILPVILATFRIGRLGAAGGVMIVAVAGGALTMAGLGPANLIHGSAVEQAQFFQFYLASTVLTALPVAADLARRREVFRRLRDSEAQLRLLTENSTDIVLSLGEDGRVRYASPSITQLGGYAPEEVIGRKALSLVIHEDRAAVRAAHLAALADPHATQIVEYRARMADGSLRWFETHSRGVADEDGHVTGVVNAIRDVSHRKTIEDELARVAATDPLTGLANRRAFDAELARRVAAVSEGTSAGHVAIFDLDHFKRVNDRYGHAAGDDVLRMFAKIARASVRDGDTVARLGGEEFGIVLGGSGREQARMVCDRIRAALAASPLRVGDVAIAVTASAGVAELSAGGSPGAALDAADAALYRAKTEGRDRLRLAA